MVANYVNDPHSTYPYSAIVHVTVTFSDGYTGSGSGVLVGRNDVLTASHVVYRPGADAVDMEIAPGSDGWNDRPYGTITEWGKVNYYQVDAIDNILKTEAGWDVAIIGLRENTGYRTGWFGIDDGGESGSYTITGYPSAWWGADGSPYMVTETNTVFAESSYSIINIGNFDITPGSSGSPVWHFMNGEPYVGGVVSTASWAADLSNTFRTVVGWMNDNDSLVAAAPTDHRGWLVFGTDSTETLGGSARDDTMHGYLGNDTLWGFTGSDIIYGNKGLDFLRGGLGDDTLYGGQNDGPLSGSPAAMRDGQETVVGADGNDLIYGNHGGDLLDGGIGNDTVFGGQNNDVIVGGAGNDQVFGNRGNDVMSGGIGIDYFFFAPAHGTDVIADFQDHDRIVLRQNINNTGITTPQDALAHVTADGQGNAVIELGIANSITLLGFAPDWLTADHFAFY